MVDLPIHDVFPTMHPRVNDNLSDHASGADKMRTHVGSLNSHKKVLCAWPDLRGTASKDWQ